MLVVADGVGGWANKGVNPGHFSRLLTKTIVDQYKIDVVDADNKEENKLHLVGKMNTRYTRCNLNMKIHG